MPRQSLVLSGMLLIFTLSFLLCSLFYVGLLNRFLRDWRSIPQPAKAPTTFESVLLPKVSVLVPARNEAANIGTLLKALTTQSYPASQLEIIVIDDHSEDETAAIVQTFSSVSLLRLQENGINSYKKKALEKGVALATGELIVCTDADCLPGSHWVERMALQYLHTQAKFIAAPVLLQHQQNWLGYLQALDFMILQGITGAGIQSGKILMANGANLAYPRSVFLEVNGYAGADQVASGDDFFLLHKISDLYPHQITYLRSKDAIVSTAAQTTWGDFLQQRIRWASKSTHYKKGGLQPVLLLVWTYNLLLLIMAMGGLFDSRYAVIFLMGCGYKAMLEWSFVSEVAHFFDRSALLKKFVWLQPLHIAYTVVAGLLGIKGGYRWKGRRVH